jgi:aspartyl-tRNA(Asn)/glutamyl-tRNA(Gln) amidotransferase subunit A
LVLHDIAGSDDNDPGSAHKSFYYNPQYNRIFPELKAGYAEIDFAEWPDEPMRPVYASALATVKSIGAQMVETRLPDFPYGPVIGAIIDSEAASIFEKFIRSGRVDQLADQSQIDGLKASLNYSALDYLKAMRVRAQVRSAFHELFATEVDLLVAPTGFSLPDRADQPFDETPPKRPDRKGVGAGLVQASNLCGLPALTVPCGFVNGLPIGLQIVGPPFSENRIVAFAREFQNRTDFHKQHPPAFNT